MKRSVRLGILMVFLLVMSLLPAAVFGEEAAGGSRSGQVPNIITSLIMGHGNGQDGASDAEEHRNSPVMDVAIITSTPATTGDGTDEALWFLVAVVSLTGLLAIGGKKLRLK